MAQPDEFPMGPIVSQDQMRSEATLVGLGPLRAASRLTVKQRIRACDIFSACTGCEVEKKYTIHGESGETLLWAKEKSNCCMRICCGSLRSLSLSLSDQVAREVITIKRPLSCSGCCCKVVYPFCTQEMSIALNGEGIVTNADCQPVATITKKWLGCCREAIIDADNFVIDFEEAALTVDDKAILLASTFLIDLMYYEESG